MHRAGRVLSVLVDVRGVPTRFVSVYAWANADVSMVDSKANAELFRHVFEEVRSTPHLPYVIVGDFNESSMHNTTLASELAAGTVVDIAGQTAFAGPQAPLMTCRAHGSVRESRRDYVLVAQPIVGWVRGVRAVEGAGYDVHKPLEVVLQPPAERLAVD
eukprot:13788379-Alexandrium_andersonii.AAC.1